MDALQFDDFIRSWATVATRRGMIRIIALLPPIGALNTLLDEESEAAKRRRRGDRRHGDPRQDRVQVERKHRKKKTCAHTGQHTSKQRKRCCVGLSKDGSGLCVSAVAASPAPTGCAPGSCGANSICVNGTCQPCDVCESGCLFRTVQAAINAASAGETIRICPGVYGEHIAIDKDLTLIGAGDGNGAGSTILQGSGTRSVVFIDATTTAHLQRLRVTGGGEAFFGGGMNNFGKLELTDCTVTGNTATSFGGGIHNGGTLTLIGCTVSGNKAGVNGGGIFGNGAKIELINSDVTGNTASDSGGGIIHLGMLTLTGSTVSGNTATDIGGGIVNSGTMTLDAASRITGNQAKGGPDSGGGIFNFGTVTLSSSDNVTGNTPDNCRGDVVSLCNG